MWKRTPLFTAHQRLGARLIEFGGWEMPLQYSGIVDEHLAVRRGAGLFDISHMGEVRVGGPGALEFLSRTFTNDPRKLAPGQAQYTLLCREDGGTIDDLYLYCLADADYLLVINAARIEADAAWLSRQQAAFGRPDEVRVEHVSDELGAVALQGPKAAGFIDQCFSGPALEGARVARPQQLLKNQVAGFPFAGGSVLVARTGYTGEDGFEIIAPAERIEAVWERLLAVGGPYGLKPAGLGARDTLRTEVCYPLYGHELDEQTSPIEAGLGMFVALDKPEFVGRAALARQKAVGVAKRCIAFKMAGKSAPPRPQYPVWSSGAEPARIGQVTSGTQSPCLGIGIGLGYVPPAFAAPGRNIDIEIRGGRCPAVIVQKPIYRRS